MSSQVKILAKWFSQSISKILFNWFCSMIKMLIYYSNYETTKDTWISVGDLIQRVMSSLPGHSRMESWVIKGN